VRGPAGAVAPRGQIGNGRRQRRRPQQNTNGSGGGDRHDRGRLRERPLQEESGGDDGGRYRGRPSQATVTERERERRRCQRPLQRAAVTGGRYRKRAAAMSAAVTGGRYCTGSGRRRWQRPLHEQCPEVGCPNNMAARF
jgi:hypothetical protein